MAAIVLVIVRPVVATERLELGVFVRVARPSSIAGAIPPVPVSRFSPAPTTIAV